MNSSARLVSSGEDRDVLKISHGREDAGLRVAAWLDDHGLRTGAALQATVRGDRLVALVRARGLPCPPIDTQFVVEDFARRSPISGIRDAAEMPGSEGGVPNR